MRVDVGLVKLTQDEDVVQRARCLGYQQDISAGARTFLTPINLSQMSPCRTILKMQLHRRFSAQTVNHCNAGTAWLDGEGLAVYAHAVPVGTIGLNSRVMFVQRST